MEQVWQQLALCASHPPETFFLGGATGDELTAREVQAKQICRGCPVLRQCRDHAVNNQSYMATWGATTPRERKRIRRWGQYARPVSAARGMCTETRKCSTVDYRSGRCSLDVPIEPCDG